MIKLSMPYIETNFISDLNYQTDDVINPTINDEIELDDIEFDYDEKTNEHFFTSFWNELYTNIIHFCYKSTKKPSIFTLYTKHHFYNNDNSEQNLVHDE